MSFWLQYPSLTFDEVAHKYSWNGKEKRGVTSVLSSVATKKGENWVPVGYDTKWFRGDETASNFGTAFHKVTQIILNGGVPRFPEAMTPWVTQFNRFVKEWNIIPLCDEKGNKIIEYPLYSHKMDVAGMPDLLAFFGAKARLAVFDWKTCTTSQKHHRAQTACYAEMCKEVFGIKQKIIHIPVRFDEKGYYPDIRDNCPEDLNWYKSVNNVLRMAA
jgi:hypothetical protein